MAGGSITQRNKIGRGYAASRVPTGVVPAGGGGWRNFGPQLGRDQARNAGRRALGRARAGMAENRHFAAGQQLVVARSPSHGQAKAVRSQRLGALGRLIDGLTNAPRQRAPRLDRAGGLPPLRPSPATTRVASASRQHGEFRPQGRFIQCPKLRSSRDRSSRPNGSGPEAVRFAPHNGVGGAGSPEMRAKTGLASRDGGAGSCSAAMVKHQANTPSVERVAAKVPSVRRNCQAIGEQFCGLLVE